ncbi:hypothetical protein JCM9279_005558 [Rhodotorula babjevae]
MPLPDVHPDGDPFAQRDAEQASASWLGRMEQRALLDQSAPASSTAAPSSPSRPAKPTSSTFAPPRTATAVKRESSPGRAAAQAKPRQSLGTDKGGREVLVVDSDDSDDDDGDHDGEDEDGSEGESGDGSGSEGEGEGEGSDTPQVAGVDDEDDEDDDDDDDDSEDDSSSNASGPAGPAGDDVEMVDGAPSTTKAIKKVVRPSTGGTGDAEMQDGDADKEGDADQPPKKKRRRRRPHSPTPPPLEHKERTTIRLEIALPPRKGAVVPEFNVRAICKEKGLIPEDDEPPKPDEDSEPEGQDKEGGAEGTPATEGGENGAPPKKKRKRGPNVVLGRFGGYDTHDPFVDDTEIGLYEPRSFARPLRDGYFIQSGPVEVLGRRGRVKGSKNKPKLDENGNPLPGVSSRRKSNKIVIGPDGKPIHVPDNDKTTEGGLPPNAGSPFPPKKVREKGVFSKELEDDFVMLKREVASTVWEQKNKFPPDLKETLIGVAFHALRLDEYDDDFFAVMPDIFGYNLFTMKKLIKREVYSGRIADLTKQQDDLCALVTKQIDEHYPVQHAEYLAKLEWWDKKQAEGGGGGGGLGGGLGGGAPAARRTPEPVARAPGFGNSPAIATPALGALDGAAAADSPAPDKGGDDEDKDSGEPKWRFRFNDLIRDALYKVGEIEDKKSELTVEKQTLEKSKDKAYSGKNARKLLYQRIVKLWPDNDVSTNQISREISNYKLKLKKAGLLPAEPSAAPAAA